MTINNDGYVERKTRANNAYTAAVHIYAWLPWI